LDGSAPGNNRGSGSDDTGLSTCDDACNREGEVRVYEPGGKLAGGQNPLSLLWVPEAVAARVGMGARSSAELRDRPGDE
jgi:hypothetical protein